MIGAKRKAESGVLATEDLVQQALREAEAQKAAKKQQKDPTGDWGNVCFYMLCFLKNTADTSLCGTQP